MQLVKKIYEGAIRLRRMEEMIRTYGAVLPGGILKVGSFLNQQIDTGFLREMGDEIARIYEGETITKILTIETSGIPIACAAGMKLGVPVVFAKKHKSSNVDGRVYSAKVHSFTHGNDYNAVVSADYLLSGDRLLIIDDFLASGNAIEGLLELARAAGASVVGCTAAIEKGFQSGGDKLRAQGIRVESLAVIESMSDDGIVFRGE